MDTEVVITEVGDELGVGLGIALLSFLLSCILPARYQWKKLSEEDQLKVIVIVSIAVGNFDFIFDVIVAGQWIQNGDWWWAMMIVCTIFTSGLVSWYYRVCHPERGKLWEKNPFKPSAIDWALLPIFVLGFGSVYDAMNVLYSGYNAERTYEFQTTRLMEIMLESLPSGALQIYILVLTSNWKNWVETVSIIASLGSVAWGLMTSSTRGIYSSGMIARKARALREEERFNLLNQVPCDFSGSWYKGLKKEFGWTKVKPDEKRKIAQLDEWSKGLTQLHPSALKRATVQIWGYEKDRDFLRHWLRRNGFSL